MGCGMWRAGGRPCKKRSLEEITNDLVNYFMKSSCMLAVIICRESVDALIISTVPIGTWPDNTLNDWIWIFRLPNILEKTSKCNSFQVSYMLEWYSFLLSLYHFKGSFILYALRNANYCNFHREFFYYYSLINCNPITISPSFPPPSLSPHLHLPPYSFPLSVHSEKNRPLRDMI